MLFPEDRHDQINNHSDPDLGLHRFLCDLMAERVVRTRVNGKNVLPYRAISDACLEQLARMLAGSAETART